jgi:hypothetical protein
MPDKPAVFKQAGFPEEQALAKDGAHNRHVPRISSITTQSGDNQAPRRKNRRWRPDPLYRKSAK